MYGILDLTWVPTATSTEPAAGQSAAIVRGDTYAHLLTFTDDADAPFAITGDVAAQIRAAKLTSDTAGVPLASFACVVSGAGDNLVTISLTSEQTLDLPASAFWDLQVDDSGTITTLLSGKVKVANDVTRDAA